MTLTTLRERAWAALGPLVLLLALLLSQPSQARAQDPRLVDAETAILEFRHESVVDTVIMALYHDGFYLPLVEVLELLGVRVEHDPARARISGFFVRADRPYELDVAAGVARIDDVEVELTRQEVIVGELDLYASVDLLERLFGFEVAIDESRLIAYLRSAEPMPVALAAQRALIRDLLAQETVGGPAAVRFPRERSVWEPGVLDYALSASAAGDARLLRLRLDSGIELFGGDLAAGATVIGDDDLSLDDRRATWRYVFDDRRDVSQVSLGTVRSAGLQPVELTGIEVTNQPVRLRVRLGTYQLTGHTRPGWDVELYVNSALAGHARADEQGRYVFFLPLRYGSTVVRLVELGPHGEIEEEERLLQIPQQLLPAGTLDYAASVGRMSTRDLTSASVRVDYGLTRFLTGSVGLDAVVDSGLPVAYGRAAAQVFEGATASVAVAPRALYQIEGAAILPNFSSFGIHSTFYHDNPLFNPRGLTRELGGHAFIPFVVSGRSGQGRISGVRRDLRDGIRQLSVGSELRIAFERFRPFIGYSLLKDERALLGSNTQQEARAGFEYLILGPLRLRRLVGGTFTRAELAYDPESNRVVRYELTAARDLRPGLRLSLGLRGDPRFGSIGASFGLTWQHPWVYSTTSLQLGSGAVAMSQTMTGSVGYDAPLRGIVPSRRTWVGGSAITVRSFLDEDGDGLFDSGEPLVPNVGVRFDRPVSMETSLPGMVRAPDLLAYHPYLVELDLGRVRNPQWVPRFETFIVQTEPNQFRLIDVPFVVSGLAEGLVVMPVGATERAVPGLRVHLREVDGGAAFTAPTFSDGVFYQLGLPPGTYTAEIDSTQLRRLRVEAQPASRTFTVRATADGDIVEGLDFILVPASTGEDVPPLEDEVQVGEGGEQNQAAAAQYDEEEQQHGVGRGGVPDGELAGDEPGAEGETPADEDERDL